MCYCVCGGHRAAFGGVLGIDLCLFCFVFLNISSLKACGSPGSLGWLSSEPQESALSISPLLAFQMSSTMPGLLHLGPRNVTQGLLLAWEALY